MLMVLTIRRCVHVAPRRRGRGDRVGGCRADSPFATSGPRHRPGPARSGGDDRVEEHCPPCARAGASSHLEHDPTAHARRSRATPPDAIWLARRSIIAGRHRWRRGCMGALLSLALALWVAAGSRAGARRAAHGTRRRWTASRFTCRTRPGLAVLGIITQRIVMPAWATSMPPEQRQLMLAHECEHVRAHDPQRLAMALVRSSSCHGTPHSGGVRRVCAERSRSIATRACWRVSTREGIWISASRGRLTRPNAGALAVPLVGLLRLPSELELRLKAMTRPRSIAVRTLAAGGAAAIAAVTAAFVAPVPTVHLPSPIATRTSSNVRRTAVSSGKIPVRETRLRENPMILRTAHAVSEYRDTATTVLEMSRLIVTVSKQWRARSRRFPATRRAACSM